jgi:hypothetical protein
MLVAAISISFCNHALCCFDSLFFLAWFQSSSYKIGFLFVLMVMAFAVCYKKANREKENKNG